MDECPLCGAVTECDECDCGVGAEEAWYVAVIKTYAARDVATYPDRCWAARTMAELRPLLIQHAFYTILLVGDKKIGRKYRSRVLGIEAYTMIFERGDPLSHYQRVAWEQDDG